MISLHDALWNLTVDDLKSRLTLVDSTPKSPRKADLLDALKAALTGELIRQEWNLLSQLEQAAVAEACYDANNLHLEERIEAKYGDSPKMYKLTETKYTSRWDRKKPNRLALFLYYDSAYQCYKIPGDLAENLRSFVSEPPPLEVATLPEPPSEEGLQIRSTEGDALAEIVALLRLAEQGKLSATAKTGMPTAAGRKAILECLGSGDFFPEEIANPPNLESWQQKIGDIKPVGWIRLMQSGGYLDSTKTKSKLTPAGIKALTKPAASVIEHLWKKWLNDKTFDEFNRIDVIKGQMAKGHMTARPPRRHTIADALSECPPNEWIDLKKFSSFMRAEGFEFEITRNPWKLFLDDPQYGSFGYDRCGGWDVLQLRYIQAFLFEYAATLGLIDLAYVGPADALPNYTNQWGADDLKWLSRYDGLRAFRITDLGAYCLGLKAEFERKKPEFSLQISISPDLIIRLPSSPLAPAERLLFETWAEPLTETTWQLDPVRSRDSIERGQNIADFGSFLRDANKHALPETVENFLKAIQRDATAVRALGEAVLFDCRDAETAKLLHADKTLKKLCQPCGKTQLVVPIAELAKFQKRVRTLGLGIA